MKQLLDTKYLKISLYTLGVIILSILASKLFSHTDNIIPKINEITQFFLNILSPVIYGFLIAYLMNPAMIFFERHLTRYFKPHMPEHFRKIRTFSICMVYLCFFGTLILTFKFLVPQVVVNIKFLIANLPDYVVEFRLWVTTLQQDLANEFNNPSISIMLNELFNPLQLTTRLDSSTVTNFITHAIDTLVSSAMNITAIILNWIIGFVISVYILMQKETFSNGSKRFLYALFNHSTASKIVFLSSETHTMVTRFFVGKSLDSVIIGIMCFIGLSIMKNPYALLLSLIIGVFNMIPYFGPVIGAVPAVILTLFTGLWPAVGVGIFVLFLQQFDGLYLGPKILGDSIGITPFWIIFAITIGGALWGPLGMFFASPILAVILNVCNRWIDSKLATQDIDLPKLSASMIITPPHPPTQKISLFKKKEINVES